MTPVTVVVPTHDRPDFAARAVRNALGQIGVDPLVVVVDNGSAPENARRVAALGGERVRVITHPRALGPNGARNVGVQAATTPWVAFLDDDDVWSPDKLRIQLALLERNPDARWCGSAAVFFDAHGSLVHWQPAPQSDDLVRTLLAANRVSGGGSVVVASRQLVLDAGGFDESLRFGEEWELWIRMALRAPAVFAPETLVAYFLQDDAGSVIDTWRHPDLLIIEERFATERARFGVELDWDSHIFATASRLMFAGRRVAAARVFATLVRRSGRLDAAAGAVGSLLAPGLTTRVAKWRSRRSMDPAVVADVERWLPAALER